MKHPFHWLAAESLAPLRSILVVLFGLVLATQILLGPPTDGPQGLLMGRVERPDLAEQMRAAWGDAGALRASVLLGYDFVFMICVGLLLSVGCVLVGRSPRRPWVERVGWHLAWIALLGTAFDWLETTLSVRLLVRPGPIWLPDLIRGCSDLKFLCWFASLAYILLSWPVRLLQPRQARTDR